MFRPCSRLTWSLVVLSLTGACQQAPTIVVDHDQHGEARSLSRLEVQKQVDPQKAVIIDVRSPFKFQLARLPRSFHVLVSDWDLDRYAGSDQIKKVEELQRFLALKGIDPWTEVLILGEGLKGKGEEFFLASTLLRLGVTRVHFVNEADARKSLRSKEGQEIANVNPWQREVGETFYCQETSLVPVHEFSAKGLKPQDVFDQKLNLVGSAKFKTEPQQVRSEDSYWAFGVVLWLKESDPSWCVSPN